MFLIPWVKIYQVPRPGFGQVPHKFELVPYKKKHDHFKIFSSSITIVH